MLNYVRLYEFSQKDNIDSIKNNNLGGGTTWMAYYNIHGRLIH